MKKTGKSLASLMIAGTLLTGMGTLIALPSQTMYAAETVAPVMAPGVINVSGTGKLTVKPDISYLSIGVQTTSTTAAKAQSANAEKMAKLNTLLKGDWKIPASDIESVQFYVQPNYDYNGKDQQKVTGYTAYHSLQVTYRNLDKLGSLLDAAAKSGANNVGSVSFGIENEDTYQEQVIAKAMANAKARAQSIAKAANLSLGSLLSVSDPGVSAPPVVYMGRQSAKATETSDAAGTSIEPGTIELNATLNVQYSMN